MSKQQSCPPTDDPDENPEDGILTLATFQRELASLEQEYSGHLAALKEADHDLSTSALEHLLLLDAAAEATQGVAEKAAQEGAQMIQRCIALNKELRGIDKLAERVKQLKRSVDKLEKIVDRLTVS